MLKIDFVCTIWTHFFILVVMTKPIWISLGLTLLMAGATVIGFVYFDLDSLFKEKRKYKSQDPYLQKLEDDQLVLEQALQGNKQPEPLIYAAMIRLSRQKNTIALKTSLLAATSQSRYLREGAAQALTNYDTKETRQKLIQLTGDPEKSVRKFALAGLRGDESSLLVGKLNTVTEKDEKFEVLRTLYLNHQIAEQKDKYLNEIKSLRESSTDVELIIRICTFLIVEADQGKQVSSYLKAKIQNSVSPRLLAFAIRTLANQKDPWINTSYIQWIHHDSPHVRKAIIQSLHRTCPENRWEILTKLTTPEMDHTVLRVAINEAQLMPGDKAEQYLNQLVLQKSTWKDEIDRAIENLKLMKQSRNPCRRPNPS